MRNIFQFGLLAFFIVLNAPAIEAKKQYTTLDKTQPIEFLNGRIVFEGREIRLDSKTFFIDGQLSDEEVKNYPYVFNSFTEAAAHFTDGTEENPMKVYIAPYVYWIDNPDDTTVRVGKDGREPFGLIVKCSYLHLIGLNTNPKNTVLAANRGQAQGAVGNFTMFDFWGDGLVVKNLTMGNFCNVDLDYPLEKKLSRTKRMSSITQAHVAYCHGDKIIAENVHFISRLNMNPLNGAKRIIFNKCHMESTDDALTGTGVYLNCTLDFYAPRPFWRSDMGGAVFLNCDIRLCHNNDRQYFCKSVGPLSIIDCRFETQKPVYIGWTHTPTDWLRCYQYNVKMNDQPYFIGAEKPYNTIYLDQSPILSAYRFTINDTVIYNTYNLLRGDDDWDPMNVKLLVQQKSQEDTRDLAAIATCLSVAPLVDTIQTGNPPLKLAVQVKRHNNYVLNNTPVKWKVLKGYEKYLKLSVDEGYECVVEATNTDDDTKHISVIAYTDDGLECATELTILPDFVEAPTFSSFPKLIINKGVATLDYSLNLENRTDESIITWFRCKDKNGADAIPVAVSRLNKPTSTYKITKEDVGYYLLVSISPKHLRCLPGKTYNVTSASPIKKSQVTISNIFETDFQTFPSANQPKLIPGCWTIDGYKPLDTQAFDWTINMNNDYWFYGTGINGAVGTGLLQNQRGARLLYTPLVGAYGNMKVTLNVDPSKTAGQGFGSPTGQYLDIYIKFDTYTLSGYALRIIRTTKYSNAVDFVLMKYENGKTSPISTPVSTNCYRTDCTITIEVEGTKLIVYAETKTPLQIPNNPEIKTSVDLEATIMPNNFGGYGFQHTGSTGESATMFHYLKAEWKK